MINTQDHHQRRFPWLYLSPNCCPVFTLLQGCWTQIHIVKNFPLVAYFWNKLLASLGGLGSSPTIISLSSPTSSLDTCSKLHQSFSMEHLERTQRLTLLSKILKFQHDYGTQLFFTTWILHRSRKKPARHKSFPLAQKWDATEPPHYHFKIPLRHPQPKCTPKGAETQTIKRQSTFSKIKARKEEIKEKMTKSTLTQKGAIN